MEILKKALYSLSLLLTVVVVTFLFLPKDQLFFLAQEEALKHKVTLKYQNLEETLFSLDVKNLEIYYVGSEIVRAKSLNVGFGGVVLENISFKGIVKKAIGDSADRVALTPTPTFLKATGSFGSAEGNFEIKKRSISLQLTPSAKLLKNKNMLSGMKKEGNKYVFNYKI
ncbi:MAG: hypothetical protein GQ570_01960 [Helicobacteraceae bacterium]|nr:hypothetical protein [Helicobacteraceae bacterium]